MLALGKNERLEDRAVGGSRSSGVILELGTARFRIQFGIPGSRMDCAPTVPLALRHCGMGRGKPPGSALVGEAGPETET